MTAIPLPRLAVSSPRFEARIAGLLYVAVIVLGGFAEIAVREGLVVAGDPSATARAIMAHESLFRWGFAAEMMTNVIAIPVTLIMYRLLVPAGRFLAFLPGARRRCGGKRFGLDRSLASGAAHRCCAFPRRLR